MEIKEDVEAEKLKRAFRRWWKPYCGFHHLQKAATEIYRAVAPSRTPGSLCATVAPGVDLCLDGEPDVHVPWGIAPSSASTGLTPHDGRPTPPRRADGSGVLVCRN
jgi:hypothetical protein